MDKTKIADKEIEVAKWMNKKGYDRRASKDVAPIIVNYLSEFKLLDLPCVTKRTYCFDYIDKTITNAAGRRVGELKSESIKADNIDQAILIFKEKYPDTPFDPPY